MNRPTLGSIASIFAAFLLVCPAAPAFEVSLDSHSIRDAYFLGQRNDEKMAQFLDTYVKRPPLPEKGPYISEIRILTPYAQIVDISRARTEGYSAQQAEMEYRSRGDLITVCVRIEFTTAYGVAEIRRSAHGSKGETNYTLRSEDFWKVFKVGLSQKDQWIKPLEQWGRSVGAWSEGEDSVGMGGAVIWLTFSVKDVDSSQASVEVVTPDGQHVIAAKFELDKLK